MLSLYENKVDACLGYIQSVQNHKNAVNFIILVYNVISVILASNIIL